MTKTLNVGLVGYKFMGKAHSNAYRQVSRFFEGLEYQVCLKTLCGRDETGVRRAAEVLGWQSYETDWRRLVARDDIDLIDVSTPGHLHAEIAIAAAQAGKMVFCEKPLGNTAEEARRMLDAVEKSRRQERGLFQLPETPGGRAGPADDRGGGAGADLSLARDVLAGLDRGPAVSPRVAIEEGDGGQRGPRRLERAPD